MSSKEGFNNLGTWLPDKIRASGLTVQEFADRCKLSRSAIYHFTGDVRRPDEKTIKKICKVLGVSLDEGKTQYTPKRSGRPRKNEGLQQSTGVAQ